jgi:hypothetical protein
MTRVLFVCVESAGGSQIVRALCEARGNLPDPIEQKVEELPL